jgi:type III pantothenate kinase
MKLLLDLGNTRIKWALQLQPQGWLSRGALDWQDDIAEQLELAWAELPIPEIVFAASVVDERREALLTILSERMFGRTPVWMRTPASACGVVNAYAEPRRLGVDRFLAMVAALASHHAPCVLVGVGTALTLDALAADGQHLGGLIAPGPQLMQQSLQSATAQVRPERPGDIVDWADNTADAVASGCWHAAAALVERFVTRVTPGLDTLPTLILGGGGAERLIPLISFPSQLNQNGVLGGLAIWAYEHGNRLVAE